MNSFIIIAVLKQQQFNYIFMQFDPSEQTRRVCSFYCFFVFSKANSKLMLIDGLNPISSLSEMTARQLPTLQSLPNHFVYKFT